MINARPKRRQLIGWRSNHVGENLSFSQSVGKSLMTKTTTPVSWSNNWTYLEKDTRLFIKLCHWFPKVPLFLKIAIFVNLEVPFLSEIRKTSVRLVVPFAKNTPHPHPNDEIRLISTSVPKKKVGTAQ